MLKLIRIFQGVDSSQGSRAWRAKFVLGDQEQESPGLKQAAFSYDRLVSCRFFHHYARIPEKRTASTQTDSTFSRAGARCPDAALSAGEVPASCLRRGYD
jgi:hypothetical protein